jgi:hypothetical protein
MDETASPGRVVPWLLIALVLAYVLERLGIALSSGHLMFHLDAGEYTPLKAVGPYLGRSTLALFLDPTARIDFFVACTAPPHGPSITPTLVLAGTIVHFAVEHLGAPLGTITVRMLSLGISTVALLSWLLLLLRCGLGPSLARRFGLLFLLAPPIFLKLNLIYWGSHELVVLFFALFLLALLPWLAEAASPRLAIVQVLVVGTVSAALSVFHGILIVPCVFVGMWLALRAVLSLVRDRSVGAGLGLGVLLAVLGTGSFLGGWWALVQLPTLAAIGLEPSFLSNNDFSTIAGGSVAAGSTLLAGMLPGDRFISSVFIQEGPLWVGLACAVALLVEAALRRRRGQIGSPVDHPLTLFLATYMLFAWVVIGAVPEEFSETRYLVTLYPVTFALVAAWSLGAGGKLRLALPVLLLLIQVPTHLALLAPGQLDAGLRYDGTKMFYAFHDEHEEVPPWEHTRLGGADRSFTLGMRILTSYQWNNSYWEWHTPAQARELAHEEILAEYLSESVDLEQVDSQAFFNGLGYAYRILLPPPHDGLLAGILALHSDVSEYIRAGYQMDPADLRWRAPDSRLAGDPGTNLVDPGPQPVGAAGGPPVPATAGERRCPSGMLWVAGGPYVLGEWQVDAYEKWVPDYVLERTEVKLEAFCMAKYPFPGRAGAQWPRDGLDLDGMPEVERQLATVGRRSCTLLELTLAAVGRDNFRYPYDRETRRSGRCDPDDRNPGPLGAFPDCVSPLGFFDFLTRASWARLDELSRAALTAQGAHHQPGFDASYVVAGGMERQDTIQAPTNFGFHIHQPGEPAFLDDGIRLCADPGPQDRKLGETYDRWVSAFFERRYIKDVLGLTHGR